MTDKKNLDLPSIKPESDQVASYRRGGRAEAPKHSNFNGLLVFTIVLMAIMMGVGGFTIYEVQERLDQSNRILEKTEKLVRDLESRLEATGTDVGKTLVAMKAQQEANFTEIDKLWKIAYRQNRPKLEALEKKLNTTSASNAELEKRVKASIGNLAKVNADMTDLKEGMSQENTELLTQTGMLRNTIQSQADSVEANKRALASLNQQVKTLDEAIAVFDQYRKQITQKFLEIQNQIPEAPPLPAG